METSTNRAGKYVNMTEFMLVKLLDVFSLFESAFKQKQHYRKMAAYM